MALEGWHRVDPVDVPDDGRVRSVVVDGRTVALARCGARLGALDNRCPHQGGPLGEGSIENGWLRCPWHGAVARPADLVRSSKRGYRRGHRRAAAPLAGFRRDLAGRAARPVRCGDRADPVYRGRGGGPVGLQRPGRALVRRHPRRQRRPVGRAAPSGHVGCSTNPRSPAGRCAGRCPRSSPSATRGKMSTDNRPAHTRAAAVTVLNLPRVTPIWVAVTMNVIEVAINRPGDALARGQLASLPNSAATYHTTW